MKKVITCLLMFFAIGTIVTVVSLSLIDNFIFSISQSSTVIAEDKTNSILKENKKIKIEDGVKDIQYAFNNKYYTYLKDSKVHINKTADATNYSVIEEENPICYYNLLYDKNLIIYITEEKSSNTVSKLTINTYDIESKRKSVYNKFSVTNFSKVKDMNMSPIINIIYINIETKTTTKVNNTIYRVDLFNSMSQVKTGTEFSKMLMLQHKDKVYYEDTKLNIYYSNTSLNNLFKQDVNMIGIDIDDNVYFLSEDKKIVYKVKDSKVVKQIELSDKDIVTTYTNNIGTYLVYPTYVIDVSAKDPYQRIALMSSYVTFEAIKDDTMYLKTSDNYLVTTKIKLEETDDTSSIVE